MMSEYGAPRYFETLSAADSVWPETLVQVSGGRLTTEEAKNLSSSERAELLSANPCAATIAWKNTLNTFLEFVCYGKAVEAYNAEGGPMRVR